MTPDDLHWTESNIESVEGSGRTLTVVASQVFVLGEHGARRMKVTFAGVSRVRSELTEYIGSPQAPQGFKTPYLVDALASIELPDTKVYGIEGITTFDPIAWIDIEVHAQGAIVEEL